MKYLSIVLAGLFLFGSVYAQEEEAPCVEDDATEEIECPCVENPDTDELECPEPEAEG